MKPNTFKKFLLILLISGSSNLLLADPPPPPPPFGPEPFDMFGPGPGGGHGHGHGPRREEAKDFERFAKELGLSQEQLDKAKAAREKRFSASRNMSEKLPKLHEDLKQILESTKVDMNAVRSKLKEIGDLQLELRIMHIQGRLEFESFLNPEQKQKLTQIHKERIQRLKDRRDHFPRPPGPPGDRDCKGI
ncbi:periplasmic heavy metal sensor [Leptospira langatensis]|uniref:Periplasmic heavy metal sensor n=1 Tax=Leptospira langatensis TaxID=2484983 RepID=A0A5F1ZR72_9LEPT|nr:periplasmic heavy metal sensor [Leptospira langatensis]TGJ99015.1 periplasmic heavy metal sensor [Leptospira langatensis]TGL40417.1 periplasmic heavy metal sensor [Leptospira langatensis]